MQVDKQGLSWWSEPEEPQSLPGEMDMFYLRMS